MDKSFWAAREEATLALARDTTTPRVREIYFDLARRYGLEAARCGRAEAAASPPASICLSALPGREPGP